MKVIPFGDYWGSASEWIPGERWLLKISPDGETAAVIRQGIEKVICIDLGRMRVESVKSNVIDVGWNGKDMVTISRPPVDDDSEYRRWIKEGRPLRWRRGAATIRHGKDLAPCAISEDARWILSEKVGRVDSGYRKVDVVVIRLNVQSSRVSWVRPLALHSKQNYLDLGTSRVDYIDGQRRRPIAVVSTATDTSGVTPTLRIVSKEKVETCYESPDWKHTVARYTSSARWVDDQVLVADEVLHERSGSARKRWLEHRLVLKNLDRTSERLIAMSVEEIGDGVPLSSSRMVGDISIFGGQVVFSRKHIHGGDTDSGTWEVIIKRMNH